MSDAMSTTAPSWVLGRLQLMGTRTYQFARTTPAGAFGAVLVLAMSVLAVFGPWIQPYGPLDTNFNDLFRSPSGDFLLGTDYLGRDQFSRLIAGARPAIFVSIASVFIGTIVGGLIGTVSGFIGGWLDLTLQRIMDGLLTMPTLILALALVTVLGRGDVNVGIAIATIAIPIANRLTRAVTLASKEETYVEAARAIGASNARVIFRHVGPNLIPPLLVVVSNLISFAIIIAAALSFLGVSDSPPTPSWGLMLSEGVDQYSTQAPWLVIGPALFIFVTILGFTLLGDAGRDYLDPRMR